MSRKQHQYILLGMAAALLLGACTKQQGDSYAETNQEIRQESGGERNGEEESSQGKNAEEEINWDYSEENAVDISLNGTQITASSMDGIIIDGSIATITSAGTYRLAGELADGEIRVNVQKEEEVYFIFDQVSICHQDGPAIYGMSGKIMIMLKEGTSNSLSDGTSYIGYEGQENPPTACLYSQDNLEINGSGHLTVEANFNDGITCKDHFKLIGGNIEITSADEGIVGRDSLQILGGTLTIHSKGDGLKSSNDEKEGDGFISVEGGIITIDSEKDGIQAATDLWISGGDIFVTTAGGSGSATVKTDNMDGFGRWGGNSDASEDTESTKGLKAASGITVTGGNISADCRDDAIHSNGDVVISGGTFLLASGDDGIHADQAVTINGGDIAVSNSYEGIEGKTIAISDGNIRIVSSDDGLNAADGSADAGWFGRGGMQGESSSDMLLAISGGYIYINAAGDGLDSNANITMTGGICIVDGPTSNNNTAVDYERSFTQTGGVLIAAGSSGMAQAISDGTQCFVSMRYNSMQQAGSAIRLTDAEGNNLITYAPAKSYSHVLISSPELEMGGSYCLYISGEAQGSQQDGLYSDDASYTGGTLVAEFTVSETGNYFSENGQDNGGTGGQNWPGNQGNQGFPGRPGGQSRPKDSDGFGEPGGQARPGSPEMPDGQGMPEMPDGQGMPEMPDGQGIPEMPDGQGIPEMPDGQGMPEMPDGQGMPEMPDIQGGGSENHL